MFNNLEVFRQQADILAIQKTSRRPIRSLAEWEEKFNRVRDEIFATLLINECAGVVNGLEQYAGAGDCAKSEYIKEYFGVE